MLHDRSRLLQSSTTILRKTVSPADVAFVARQLGIDVDQANFKAYDKQTLTRHQSLILSHFGVTPFDAKSKVFLAKEIAGMVRVQLRPKLVFVEAVQVLLKKKIAIPSYSALSAMILTAVNKYHGGLVKIIESNLTKKLRNKLEELLNKDPGGESSWRYPITRILCNQVSDSTGISPSGRQFNIDRTAVG